MLAALWRLGRQVQASSAQVADLRALASTDPLTGLANRRALSMRLTAEEQRCCRSGLSAGILVLDVDDLKGSNDRLGHAAGDEILCHVAAALRRVTRAGDLIARTGGDEFVALMVDLPVGGLADVKERIERELTTTSVSASVGWAERSAAGGLEAAWHVADLEMYHQKLSRRASRQSQYRRVAAVTIEEEPPMTPHQMSSVRAEALFASPLQRSQAPTPVDVRRAASAALLRHGTGGCAQLVAQEFGEHPDEALNRMRWILTAMRSAYPQWRTSSHPRTASAEFAKYQVAPIPSRRLLRGAGLPPGGLGRYVHS